MTTYTPESLPDRLEDGDIIDIAYSGNVQALSVQPGRWKLEVWGAQGGYRSSTSYGGKGGYATGIIELSDPTTLYCRARGSGNTAGKSSSTLSGKGGFNGGGLRAYYAGGGGASDIRIGEDSLLARVIVAGGGGSDGGSSKAGGAAGAAASSGYGTNNGAGNTTYSGSSTSTTASSQSTVVNASSTAIYGGFGFGGNGQYRSSGYGGAGGGGWYGGSGTYPDGSSDDDKGGSGGSGYVWTEDTASQYPTGCLLDADLYLSETSVLLGSATITSPSGTSETGHSGDGHVRLTLIKSFGFTATFIIGESTVTSTVMTGDPVEFPSSTSRFEISYWTVEGVRIDSESYTIDADTTFVAVGRYIWQATMVIAGSSSTIGILDGEAPDLPTKVDNYYIEYWTVEGRIIDGSAYRMSEDTTFVAWGGNRFYPSDFIGFDGDRTLYAKYDTLYSANESVTTSRNLKLYAVWAGLTVELTPNPVDAGKGVLVTVGIVIT